MIAARPGELLALDGGQFLWRAESGGDVLQLTRLEAATWELLSTFAPAGLQRQRLVQALRCGEADAERALARALALGLLVSPSQCLPQPAAAEMPPASLGDPLLVIRAYERPDGLAHLLDSLRDDQKRHGVRRRHVVVDDTRSPEAAQRTAESVAGFAQASGSEIFLLGPAQREAALKRLTGALDAAGAAALRAALDPAEPSAVTGSRTWNWAVLLAAGQGLSILDDDIRFEPRTLPQIRHRIDLLDANEPVVRWFDGEVNLPAFGDEAYSALSNVVGLDAADVLRRDGWDESLLLHRSPRELAHLRQGRVLAAVPGTWGTIPLDSSVYLTCLGPDSQADLFRAPYRHERLAADRVAQGYEATRLTSYASYTPLLSDDRELLPFAGTWGRVDDTYFLTLLRQIEPHAVFAHVPLLIGHRDYGDRARLQRAQLPLQLDCNSFVASVFIDAAAGLQSRDRARRLAAIGARCGDVAQAEDAEMVRLLQRWRGQMTVRVMQQLERGLLQYKDAPLAWRDHVARIIAVNRAHLLVERVEAEELTRVRRALKQVADLAPVWPLAWQCARELGHAAFAQRVTG